MENIKCQHCGKESDYEIIVKGVQHTCWCKDCGCFIKNIGYAEPAFYVGKYKGTLIADCTDRDYLIWFGENVAKNKIKEAVMKRIAEL